MTDNKFATLIEQLQHFDTAHVVTRNPEGTLTGRPLAIAGITAEGHLWFITNVKGSVVQDITEHPGVAVCLQSGGHFVSISGLARTSRDRSRIDKLWDPEQAVWFEQGRDDPEVILLEIVPMSGEFWDRSGMRGIDFKLKEVGAMITGRPLAESAGTHGRVEFDAGRD